MSARHTPHRTLGRAGVAFALAALAVAAAAQEAHRGPDGGRGSGGRPAGVERGAVGPERGPLGVDRGPSSAERRPSSADPGAHVDRLPQQRPPGGAGRAGPGERGPAPFGAPHMRFDDRFHDGRTAEGHYYPARGYVSASLPPGALNIGYRGGRYFYQGGVWFRPYGARFTVIAPPFGIVLPVLPLAYTTLWFGGAPYYYANDVYYASAPGGYRVVAPPPGIETAPVNGADQPPPPAAAAPPEPIFYPRNGQTPEQTEADRQQCNSWATTQPGAVADAGVFQRAVAACMDGRGYTVR